MNENMFHYDLDGDGGEDLEIEYELDAQDHMDSMLIDTDEDESMDSILFDTDGEDRVTSILLDTNGDGSVDSILMDIDQDGDIDTIFLDTDYDGEFDTFQEDTNGDGIFEIELQDTDQDGIFDFERYDTNNDGIMDTVCYAEDNDGDGEFDIFMKEQYEDTDGDGEIDMVIISRYDELEENFEVLKIRDIGHEEMIGDEVDKEEWIEIEPVFGDEIENVDLYVNLEHFDANETDTDCIVGNPEISMKNWENQNHSGTNALYAQKFIIEEFTGQEVDMNEMLEIAQDHYWYHEGTSCMFLHKMLEYYGLECENTYGGTFKDISKCLNQGGRVIVAVNSDEFRYVEHDDINNWNEQDELVYTPTDTANHAVEVIGIDYSDKEEPKVILNDPGVANGCGVMVPYHVFMESWEDSDYQIVTCYSAE